MVEIKEISYEDDRLGFFADQRKLVQKRYDRLEKQIKPDEPYLSERRQFLSDLGRELSFYNDVIEMLENDVVSKSQVELYTRLNSELEDKLASTYDELASTYYELKEVESKVAKKIFKEIDKLIYRYLNNANYSGGDMVYDIADLKVKYSAK